MQLPKNTKKKCASFVAGCIFSDDWKQGCVVKVGSKLGFLHLWGPDNGKDEFGAGWHNKFGDTIPGCLYAKKKSIELLKSVQYDANWGFRYFEVLEYRCLMIFLELTVLPSEPAPLRQFC